MMKKIIILSVLVLFTLVANAAGQSETKEKVIDRAKAIAAYHIIFNKSDGGQAFKDPKAKELINAQDIDALEKLIKSDPDKKYKNICDEIEGYFVDDKDLSSLIKSFEGLLKKYRVNDSGALEQVKIPIIKSSKLFIHEENDVKVSDEDVDNDNEGTLFSASSNNTEGKKTSGTVKTKEDSQIEESSQEEKSESITAILPIVILFLALLVLLFICYNLWNKQKLAEEENKTVVKALSQMANHAYAKKSLPQLANAALVAYNNLERKIQKIESEKKVLEKERDDLKDRLVRRNDEYHNPYSNSRESGYNGIRSIETKDDESCSPTVTWNIQKENDEKAFHEREVILEKVESLVGKEMFLYLPNEGIFKDGSEEYRPGKTLYKMIYTSDETADFEFVKKAEALAFAKQSRSRFLEGACIIENDDAESFNTIVTLDKGKLVKNNEGWEIISKARIRLS